jgi:DNA-binding Lrp family transcriptional regulator
MGFIGPEAGPVAVDTFDELDFRVLRELMIGSGAFLRSDRVSLEAVARALGVHRSTVSARLAKWVAAGALAGFSIEIEPGALGLVTRYTQLHARAHDRERAVETALLVDGVRSIMLMDGGWVGILAYGDSHRALEQQSALCERLFDADERLVLADSEEDYPDTPRVEISRLDARLLAALLHDSRTSPSALAKTAGVAARTVERRLARLQKEGVYFVLPKFDPKGIRGMVMGLVSFRVPPEGGAGVVADAYRRVPNPSFRQMGRTRAAIGLNAPTLRELEAAGPAVAAIPGARDVRVRVLHEIRQSASFDAWLRERFERAAAASSRRKGG